MAMCVPRRQTERPVIKDRPLGTRSANDGAARGETSSSWMRVFFRSWESEGTVTGRFRIHRLRWGQPVVSHCAELIEKRAAAVERLADFLRKRALLVVEQRHDQPVEVAAEME